MKIDDISLSPLGSAAQAVSPGSASRASGSPQAAPAAAAVDSATLSAGANQLAGDQDVRMEKVAAVQQALESGTYQVSAGDLADRLMASMLQKP